MTEGYAVAMVDLGEPASTSYWIDRSRPVPDDPPPVDGRLDDLVVGAGLTGLVTAVLLARAGRRVSVIEARQVGAVTSGRTTAKVSLLQGTRYRAMLRLQPASAVRGYVDANREGLEWLRRFADEHGVAGQSRDAVTFAAGPEDRSAVEGEHEAATMLGLPVVWADELDVPFGVYGATVLAGQLQVDPMAVLAALVAELRAHGGSLHQGRRVREVAKTGVPWAELDDGTRIACEHLVLATGTPILDRGLHFAKLEPERSYLLAFTGVEPTALMCLSAGSSSRSVRDVPPTGDGGPVLLVGGSGHPVGRDGATTTHLDELRRWTADHYPGAVETHAWSAQDYAPYSGLPMVGPILPGAPIFVATGFAKWGMAAGVAAARTIVADILGGQGDAITGWTSPWRPSARSLGRAVRINAAVGQQLATGLARAESRPVPPAGAETGRAVVGREGLVPVAVPPAGSDGCRLRATCTHLGGIVGWNDAERSWDCPLHGSRFAPDGSVLEGPATRALPPA